MLDFLGIVGVTPHFSGCVFCVLNMLLRRESAVWRFFLILGILLLYVFGLCLGKEAYSFYDTCG